MRVPIRSLFRIGHSAGAEIFTRCKYLIAKPASELQIHCMNNVLRDLLIRQDLGFETASDQDVFLEEVRALGAKVIQFDFSGIKVEGITRSDARERLMYRTFSRAFTLFKTNFGSAARFRPRCDEEVTFFWRKADLLVIISGPLSESFFSEGQLQRDPLCNFRFSRATDDIPTGIHELQIPYYNIWHNPTAVVLHIRKNLIRSGAYPRLVAPK